MKLHKRAGVDIASDEQAVRRVLANDSHIPRVGRDIAGRILKLADVAGNVVAANTGGLSNPDFMALGPPKNDSVMGKSTPQNGD